MGIDMTKAQIVWFPNANGAAPSLPSHWLIDVLIMPDKDTPDTWRVEAIDHSRAWNEGTDCEGEITVAIFSGPDAEARAREYADWKWPGKFR